jgi:hypothetical protein
MPIIIAVDEKILMIVCIAGRWRLSGLRTLKQCCGQDPKEDLEDLVILMTLNFESPRPEEVFFAEDTASQATSDSKYNEDERVSRLIVYVAIGFEEHKLTGACWIDRSECHSSRQGADKYWPKDFSGKAGTDLFIDELRRRMRNQRNSL